MNIKITMVIDDFMKIQFALNINQRMFSCTKAKKKTKTLCLNYAKS